MDAFCPKGMSLAKVEQDTFEGSICSIEKGFSKMSGEALCDNTN